MLEALDVLDVVEGEVEGCEGGEGVEPFDVRERVVVEVEFLERCAPVGGEVGVGDVVLAEAEALCNVC